MRMRDVRLDMFTRRGGMSCVQVVRVLQRYLDGGLDDADRERVAAHLSLCRRCGLDEHVYAELKAALADKGRRLPDQPVVRLRAFAARLATSDPPPADTEP